MSSLPDPAPPELADLYRMGELIERDKSSSIQALRERDHLIGAECAARDDLGRLLFWARSERTGQGMRASPRRSGLSESTLSLVVKFSALVLGFLAMVTFLLASGRGLVNVFVFLLLFVFIQLLFCLFSVLLMFSLARGPAAVVLPLNPARWMIARVFPDPRFLRESQAVVRLLVLRFGQEFGALFTMGAVAAFFGVLALNDFTFVWGSTFEVSDNFVRGLTHWISVPWQSWLPAASLPAQVIADTRYHPAVTALESADMASMRGWWPFLAMAMLTYALLPRVLLWLLSRLLYTRMMRQSILSYPGSDNILARMQAPVISTRATEVEDPGQKSAPAVSLDDSLMLLNWAGALAEGESACYSMVNCVPPANVMAAGVGSLADDEHCRQQIDRYQPERLLVAVRSWEPPMADLSDFLSALEKVRRCTLCLVPLPDKLVPDRNLQEWSGFARALSLEVADAQGLVRL